MTLPEGYELRDFIQAASFLVGGVVLGLLISHLLRVQLGSTMTRWRGKDIATGAIHDAALVGFILAGAYGAVQSLPLGARTQDLITRGILVVIILAVTIIVARLCANLIKLYALRVGGGTSSSSLFVTIAYLVVTLIGILIALGTMGISITPLLTALGVGGLAVALALQDTLANLFAGIHLVASRKIRPGDYIKLDTGDEGYVTDINWRNTIVRQLPNNMVIVPNATMSSSVITNYYRPQRELAVLVDVGVSYGSDLEHVEAVTIEVATSVMQEVMGAVPKFEPFIRYGTFGDSSINLTVIMRAREFTDTYLVKHEFIKRLHRRYAEEGIVIPFPQRVVHQAPGE